MINKKLSILNSAQLGSFGEYLVTKFFDDLGCIVTPVHKSNIDLQVKGKSFDGLYDVKSTRGPLVKAKHFGRKPPHYYGFRKANIGYIVCGFYTDCAVIAEHGKLLRRFIYEDVNQLFTDWSLDKKLILLKNYCQVLESYNFFIEITKKVIREQFAIKNKKVRIIYRNGVCNQFKFGKYGPFNLLPRNPEKEQATVVIWTEDESIYKLIAFRHSDIKKLPVYNHQIGHRHCETMMLTDFEEQYVFSSIEELKEFPR